MPFPFSPKLRLAVLWPALIAVLVSTALLWNRLPTLFETSSADDLVDAGRLLAAAQADRLPALRDDAAAAEAWAISMAGGAHLRITLIRSDGSVIADSARTTEQVGAMENHAGRPEVIAAMANGAGTSVRRSDTTGITYAYAARTVALPDGGLLILRLARPVDSLPVLNGHLARTLLFAIAAALLGMIAVSWWLTRSLFDPLLRTIHGAERLAGGDLQHRLETPDEQELSTLARAVNRLAEQVGYQIAAAGEERDHLHAILASMSDGVVVTDHLGRARFTNAAFHRLFDVQGDLTGRTALEISRQGTLARLIEATIASGQPLSGELEQDTPTRRTLALTAARLTTNATRSDGDGNGASDAGCVVVARDITAFTRLSDMRRDFVANVSHELKTPLAAIRGYAETLRDGALDDREAAPRFIGRVLEQCKRLQALLDDLLTLSRLEGTGSAPERQWIDLLPLTRRAVETLAPAAVERRVRVEIQGQMPPFSGDLDGMERMLTNLIDNAVKYNRPGGTVTVALGGTTEEATIEVRDTGIGIPPDSLPRIFERFYRVDKGRSREEGGTGLGLAIVKHVAHVHGGRVEVESTLGEGSRFRVYLPIAAPPAVVAGNARK